MERHESEGCSWVQRAIPWFLDGELDPQEALAIEGHVDTCDACRCELEREGALRMALRRAADSVHAPTRLRRSVRALVEAEVGHRRGVRRWWPAAAAAAILAAFVWHGFGQPSDDVYAVAMNHRQNLPFDVVAPSVSQVQGFFRDKLPFAVALPRFAPGLVLRLGGRLVRVHGKDAAYVRYETPLGRLSVLVNEDDGGAFANMSEVFPSYRLADRRVRLERLRGYTVARWREGDLRYTVVSDLSTRELARMLVSAMR